MSAQREHFYTACPHDCPSTCALHVEKLEDGRVGKVRGAADHTYTQGVICSKAHPSSGPPDTAASAHR